MTRLIDADALTFKKTWWRNPDGQEYEYEHIDKYDIDTAPTIDAVEVVRCKDCKYYVPHEIIDEKGWCDGVMEDLFDDNFYCSYGERREDD